jgi:hypothetical protein
MNVTVIKFASWQALVKGVFPVERLVSHLHNNNTPRVSSTPSIMQKKRSRSKGKGGGDQDSDGSASTSSTMQKKRPKRKGNKSKGKRRDDEDSDGSDKRSEDNGQQSCKRRQMGPQSGSGERLFVGE